MKKNLIRESTPNSSINFKCEHCCSFPEFTIFNSSNRVNIFSSCDNKHINISLLDDYIKRNISYYGENKYCEN